MKPLNVGFVVDDLSSGQIPFLLVKNTNEYIQKKIDVNINIFMEENLTACINPLVSRFYIRDAFLFDGHLIATSLKTTKAIQSFTRSKRYFYIHDLEYLRKDINLEDWTNVLKDRDIKKFTRSSDHFNKLKEDSYDISNIIVEDFNIEQILKVINEDTRH